MLTFTVNLLLKGLTTRLSAGDLDPCLDILIEVKAISDWKKKHHEVLGTYSGRGRCRLPLTWWQTRLLCVYCQGRRLFYTEASTDPLVEGNREKREVKYLWGCILSCASWEGMDSRLRHLTVFSCTLNGRASQQTSTQCSPQSPGTQLATQMGYIGMYWSDCNPIPCITTPEGCENSVLIWCA